MADLPEDFLSRVVVHVGGAKGKRQSANIAVLQPVYAATLAAAGVASDGQVALFTGQIAVESDQLCAMAEYASGAAYEGRDDLGNTEPGDGRRFKGRGLIQLTGRANYTACGRALGIDLVWSPELAEDPIVGLRVALWFWTSHNLERFADIDDVRAVTRVVNGGLNGLAEREAATERAFRALGYVVEDVS